MKSISIKSPLNLPKPATSLIAIFVLLTLLMLATRTHHFSAFDQLPSASIAIFFLAGMYLRSLKSFWFFYILSIVIDLASSYYRGQLGDCLTVSYPALAFSYAAMFAAGFYSRANWLKQPAVLNIALNVLKICIALFVASSIAFLISNGSYYLFSGKFPEPNWAEYTLRVDKYYFRSISNPVFYVICAVVIDVTVSRFLSAQALKNPQNSTSV
ncbi:MAG: hypothetical protein ACSHW0_06295 [Thalassotalea sp.]